MLIRHPRVVDKILEETRAVFTKADDCRSPSFDVISSSALPYTFAVFNETIRLYPPVPVELKECTQDSTFPDGTWLPKAAVVMWAPWSIGRSKRIWGCDADLFRPERWLIKNGNGNTCLLSKTAYEFPVFNGGPRSCLGKRMAELLALCVIVSLTRRYKFIEPVSEHGSRTKERRSQNSLTLPMENGCPCQIQLR